MEREAGERRPTAVRLQFEAGTNAPPSAAPSLSPRSVAESKVRSVVSRLHKPESKLLAPESVIGMGKKMVRHAPPSKKKDNEDPRIDRCKFGLVTYVSPDGIKNRVRVVVTEGGEIGWNLKDVQSVVGAATHILRKKMVDLRPLVNVQYDPLNIFEGVTKDGMFLLGLHIPKHARPLHEWSMTHYAHPQTTFGGRKFAESRLLQRWIAAEMASQAEVTAGELVAHGAELFEMPPPPEEVGLVPDGYNPNRAVKLDAGSPSRKAGDPRIQFRPDVHYRMEGRKARGAILSLLQSSGWRKGDWRGHVRTLTKPFEQNFGRAVIKAITFLRADVVPLEEVVRRIWDSEERHKWDSYHAELFSVGTFGTDVKVEYAKEVQVDPHHPPRDLVLAYSKFEHGMGWLIAGKSVEHENFPPTPIAVRSTNALFGYEVVPRGRLIQVTFLHQCEEDGSELEHRYGPVDRAKPLVLANIHDVLAEEGFGVATAEDASRWRDLQRGHGIRQGAETRRAARGGAETRRPRRYTSSSSSGEEGDEGWRSPIEALFKERPATGRVYYGEVTGARDHSRLQHIDLFMGYYDVNDGERKARDFVHRTCMCPDCRRTHTAYEMLHAPHARSPSPATPPRLALSASAPALLAPAGGAPSPHSDAGRALPPLAPPARGGHARKPAVPRFAKGRGRLEPPAEATDVPLRDAMVMAAFERTVGVLPPLRAPDLPLPGPEQFRAEMLAELAAAKQAEEAAKSPPIAPVRRRSSLGGLSGSFLQRRGTRTGSMISFGPVEPRPLLGARSPQPPAHAPSSSTSSSRKGSVAGPTEELHPHAEGDEGDEAERLPPTQTAGYLLHIAPDVLLDEGAPAAVSEGGPTPTAAPPASAPPAPDAAPDPAPAAPPVEEPPA